VAIKLHENVPASPHKFAAIITLDPASVGPCGIACRATASLPDAPVLDKLRAPDFIYEGAVFNDVMLDELAAWCARNVGGQKLLLCAEATAYGSMSIARSLGRCVGAVELLLYYCGWGEPAKTEKLYPVIWRKAAGISSEIKGRDQQKEAAVQLVESRYRLTLGSDAAEAVLMNDAVVMGGNWRTKKRGKK
jgi:hypothetical protein